MNQLLRKAGKKCRTLTLMALLLCASLTGGTAWAGPIVLFGHDADDHGKQSTYATFFDNILTNVTNSGSGIVAVGVTSGTKAGNWISAVAALMSTPQTVTYVDTVANINTLNLAGVAILHVASDFADTPGGITEAENNALTNQAGIITAFVNGGGGLVGLTQDDTNITQHYGYLTGPGGLGAITTANVPPSGIFPTTNEQYNNITPTAAGVLLGITDTNIDGCCWHNAFTAFPSFLNVLATVNEPNAPDFNGLASVIGGAAVTIQTTPEPSTMLLLGSGLAGLVARRMRKAKV